MAITLRFTKGHATGSDFVLFVDTDSELRQDLDRAARVRPIRNRAALLLPSARVETWLLKISSSATLVPTKGSR
jgi:hypothetical protein